MRISDWSSDVCSSDLVALAALTSVNATIFTGARTNYALGRDFKAFRWLGKWHDKTSSPIHALLAQGIVALVLIGLGSMTRDGFQSMVEDRKSTRLNYSNSCATSMPSSA